jgi:hypothetical protein
MREIFVTTFCALVLTPFLIFSVSLTGAQVMQSGSYRIQSDSINFGGGFSTSTSYVLESTGGEIATGESSSVAYGMRAGYQQMQEVYISLSGFTAIDLSPSISGITGGTSNGSTTVTVVTDGPSGYELQIAASQSPAMQKGVDSISDYTPVGANPDLTFITDPTDSQFGYSPEGVDIVARYKDDGVSCGTGSGDTSLACWDGLSTTDRTVASRTSANHPNGSTTTLNFRVGVGGSVSQPPGMYIATTTITALPL